MECVSVTKMVFKMCIQPLTSNYATKIFYSRSFLQNRVIILVIVLILNCEYMKFYGDKPVDPPIGSAAYKRLYDSGSIMSVNEDGELTDQLDEVVLKAYNRNNLSEDEKKVYDKFYTGKLNKFTTNPDYDPSQKRSKTNKPKIKAENPKRDFRNTQNIRNGGERFVLDAYGAVKMFKDSEASFSEEPALFTKIFPSKYRYDSNKPSSFRGHADPLTSTIHVGKDSKISTVVAELAHVFPGMAANPTIKGTYEKTKRFFKEGGMPDKSNYKSKHDLEYKTHTGPNSVENRLLKKYGTQY